MAVHVRQYRRTAGGRLEREIGGNCILPDQTVQGMVQFAKDNNCSVSAEGPDNAIILVGEFHVVLDSSPLPMGDA